MEGTTRRYSEARARSSAAAHFGLFTWTFAYAAYLWKDDRAKCSSSTAIMAALHAPSASFLSAFLPIVRATLNPGAPITRRIPLFSHLRTSILPAALLPIPSLLGEIWDGILRAVPKKKTSHMKKRHRQMAGKALKDVTSLNKCSSCGRPKRAHVLCPYCVKSIQAWLANGFKSKEELKALENEKFDQENEDRVARGLKPRRKVEEPEK
ncbi:Hypothetical protein R9X50_00110800 [Acrodontium crateriforme]|uniref:Large ribosomal subunit protein bL32m n=1 Tax=Acrodontium crateriforme TaxID=150365 RepID=A0AAQ3R7T6_9PEZI|nr:Hypothetical protein R9X50_00110800 [Acrodontium crateriforme]